MKKLAQTLLIVLLCLLSACKKDNAPEGIDFRAEMRMLVQEIASKARLQNPDFVVIPQNGQELVTTGPEASDPLASDYVTAISALSREDLHYGYNKDDDATPSSEQSYIKAYLDKALAAGKPILVTDYCSTASKMDDAYLQSISAGYVGFAADHRELDNIPSYPQPISRENSDNISTIDQVRNYLYLINPSEFASRQAFVDAVRATNYDLLIMDLFFNDGSSFTAAELESMKDKANGGRRLIVSYMSIGEAEDYRFYWQSDWKYKNPDWLRRENKNWKGNYKVWYWDPEWKGIIYDNADSYLSKIQSAGFDGVFLDIIDAFEYFEAL